MGCKYKAFVLNIIIRTLPPVAPMHKIKYSMLPLLLYRRAGYPGANSPGVVASIDWVLTRYYTMFITRWTNSSYCLKPLRQTVYLCLYVGL